MILYGGWKSFGTSARAFQGFPSHCTGPGTAEMILECWILDGTISSVSSFTFPSSGGIEVLNDPEGEFLLSALCVVPRPLMLPFPLLWGCFCPSAPCPSPWPALRGEPVSLWGLQGRDPTSVMQTPRASPPLDFVSQTVSRSAGGPTAPQIPLSAAPGSLAGFLEMLFHSHLFPFPHEPVRISVFSHPSPRSAACADVSTLVGGCLSTNPAFPVCFLL